VQIKVESTGFRRTPVKLEDFSYELPDDRIAQQPLAARDASRLLLLSRQQDAWEDRVFAELPSLLRGDELLVVNNARVIPARLFGRRRGDKSEPAGKQALERGEYLSSVIEVLLTRNIGGDLWEALVRPGRKVRVGEHILFGEGELEAEVMARGKLGLRQLKFSNPRNDAADTVQQIIERLGHVPLPPYIRRNDETDDRTRYQTVFARRGSAVAAPTAGLHFTDSILEKLRARGAEICEITLNVSLGTFQPIHEEEIERHAIHTESYEIPEETVHKISFAKKSGRPVLAVGTTVVRTLEDAARKASAANANTLICAGSAEADIFIYPGHEFRIVDQVLTNFHLPRSTLLAMIAAFAGLDLTLRAYRHAIAANYRFYSYGDCMLIR
jgi:S-adenosylmethionine:tRNA ribosyltransferase-isomerase